MNKNIFLITAVLLFIGANASNAEVKTVMGEVIDVSCYVAEGAKGEDHKTCAIDCLKAGEPAGILEEGTGKVYVVVTKDHTTNPASKVLPFVAKMVNATGTVNERNGMATIDITDIKEASDMSAGMMKEKNSM